MKEILDEIQSGAFARKWIEEARCGGRDFERMREQERTHRLESVGDELRSRTEGMFDALLAVTDPGDEVILTDPTYAGMIYRVRLAGAVPRLAPFVLRDGAWRLDLEALRAAVGDRTRAIIIMNPSMHSGAVLNR